MIWVIVILLLVVWVFFGTYIRIAILSALVYYFCKNLYRLFGVLGPTGRKILVVAAIMFLAYCSQNFLDIPIWLVATIAVTLAYHAKKPVP